MSDDNFAFDAVSTPITLDYPATVELPDTFPSITPKPRFQFGDRLRYLSLNASTPIDRGQVLGWYYCYASHRQQWMWRYILWLAVDSPSSAWLKATVVWEDDLEVDCA